MFSPKVSLTLPLSPKHQSSISQSQAIDSRVTEFLKNSIKIPMESSQKMSSSSLSNSNAFFESEIKHLIKVVEKANEKYQEREKEFEKLQKKVEDYEEEIRILSKQNLEETAFKSREKIEKWKQEQKKESEQQNDEVKTRKRADENQKEKNFEESTVRPIFSKTSEFEFTVDNKNKGLARLETDSRIRSIEILENELLHIKNENKFLKEQREAQYQQHEDFIKNQLEIRERLIKSTEEVCLLKNQKDQIEMEYKILKSRYEVLKDQYNIAEEKFGKEISEYKIIVENLREVLRNLERTKSPKRKSKKEEEGYYSINKKMKESGKSFSSESDASSFKSSASEHLERNLKEENELLRTELIKAFDEKGAMKSELKKYKKLIDRLTREKEELNKSENLTDENNRSSINKKIEDIDDTYTSKIFKKNKASILIVENTELKEKEIMEKHKISNLLKELNFIINSLTGNNHEDIVEILEAKAELFKEFIHKLQNFYSKQSELNNLLNNTKQENEQLKKEKKQIQDKSKQDIAELQSFLHEMSQNKSQIKSEDSTDQTFKNIKLEKEIFEENKSFAKEREYEERLIEKENEINALKNRVIYLEEGNESLYKLTENHSSSNYNHSSQNQLIPVSKNHENLENKYENTTLELCELFKQQLKEFYELTMRALDECEKSADKSLKIIEDANKYDEMQNNEIDCLPEKVTPEVKSEVYAPLYCIPEIIQRNILKISREFKSIKGTEEDNTPRNMQEGCENEFFANQKMSRSFVSDDKRSETMEEMINKKIIEFQEFSTDWIMNRFADLRNDERENLSEKIQDLTIKPEIIECSSSKRFNTAMTERPSVEREKMFEIDMNEIDANSESVTSQELTRERQLFIREEVSYYLSRNESLNNLMRSANSKKSFHSFRI